MIILSLLLTISALANDDFRFAYRDSATLVSLQAHSQSAAKLLAACGPEGKRCNCEVQANTGVLGGTLTYDQTGHYFQCEHAPAASAEKVRIFREGHLNASLPILSTLTFHQLLGPDLDHNYVRTIFGYQCLHNYLEKRGTTETSFDCSNSYSLCWSRGSSAGNFCTNQISLPYHLFADNYSSNFAQKASDNLYGSGNGICGIQLKQHECTNFRGTPVAEFGTYGEKVGIWEQPLSFSSGPWAPKTTYGFAAKKNKSGFCPPGLEKRAQFRAELEKHAIAPDSNLPQVLRSELFAAEVPASIIVGKTGGGNCDGNRCTAPTLPSEIIAQISYGKTGTEEFCVIPTKFLP